MENISKSKIAIQDQNAVIISKIKSFCQRFSISSILMRSGISKLDGIPVTVIFISILSLVFTGKSFARAYQEKTEGFSDDAIHRFLGNPKHNWRRFLLSVTHCIIHDFVQPLTDDKRVKCLIADDSIFTRNRSKKVELLAWVFDHSIGKMMRGFRMLTLAWTDGFSTFCLDFSLLSSGLKEKRFTGITKDADKRSCGYLRRMESMKEAPEVLADQSNISTGIEWNRDG